MSLIELIIGDNVFKIFIIKNYLNGIKRSFLISVFKPQKFRLLLLIFVINVIIKF